MKFIYIVLFFSFSLSVKAFSEKDRLYFNFFVLYQMNSFVKLVFKNSVPKSFNFLNMYFNTFEQLPMFTTTLSFLESKFPSLASIQHKMNEKKILILESNQSSSSSLNSLVLIENGEDDDNEAFSNTKPNSTSPLISPHLVCQKTKRHDCFDLIEMEKKIIQGPPKKHLSDSVSLKKNFMHLSNILNPVLIPAIENQVQIIKHQPNFIEPAYQSNKIHCTPNTVVCNTEETKPKALLSKESYKNFINNHFLKIEYLDSLNLINSISLNIDLIKNTILDSMKTGSIHLQDYLTFIGFKEFKFIETKDMNYEKLILLLEDQLMSSSHVATNQTYFAKLLSNLFLKEHSILRILICSDLELDNNDNICSVLFESPIQQRENDELAQKLKSFSVRSSVLSNPKESQNKMIPLSDYHNSLECDNSIECESLSLSSSVNPFETISNSVSPNMNDTTQLRKKRCYQNDDKLPSDKSKRNPTEEYSKKLNSVENQNMFFNFDSSVQVVDEKFIYNLMITLENSAVFENVILNVKDLKKIIHDYFYIYANDKKYFYDFIGLNESQAIEKKYVLFGNKRIKSTALREFINDNIYSLNFLKSKINLIQEILQLSQQNSLFKGKKIIRVDFEVIQVKPGKK